MSRVCGECGKPAVWERREGIASSGVDLCDDDAAGIDLDELEEL
jgi:hypothetical protein